jgi:hypothetical protein
MSELDGIVLLDHSLKDTDVVIFGNFDGEDYSSMTVDVTAQ